MQEPEQWQDSREYGGYRAEYPGQEEPEQEQKIYPQEEQRVNGIALGILAIILSSLGQKMEFSSWSFPLAVKHIRTGMSRNVLAVLVKS